MSEINNDKSIDTFRNAAIAATVLIGVSGLGQNVVNASEQSDRDAASNTEATQQTAYVEIIKDKLADQFDASQIIGEPFTLERGQGYGDASLAELRKEYGEEKFNDIKPLIYDQLMTAAKYQVVAQPDQTYVLVEEDIDNDGKGEYFPVNQNQIVRTSSDGIPTPNTR